MYQKKILERFLNNQNKRDFVFIHFNLFTFIYCRPDFSQKQNINKIILNLSFGKLKTNLYSPLPQIYLVKHLCLSAGKCGFLNVE